MNETQFWIKHSTHELTVTINVKSPSIDDIKEIEQIHPVVKISDEIKWALGNTVLTNPVDIKIQVPPTFSLTKSTRFETKEFIGVVIPEVANVEIIK